MGVDFRLEPRSNATEIVGNVTAMLAALRLADRLDADAILGMHAALLEVVEPAIAGRWRTEQVWIVCASFGRHEADFVPPHHRQLPALIADLIRFLGRNDLPVLAQAALAHAQFETIHPFADGNGRTGRALVHALLRGRGLTRQVTVPVSAGLLRNVGAYFDALTAYRAGDPGPIIRSFADASLAAVTNGRQLVEELRVTRAGWDDRVHARQGSSTWRLADQLLRQPVVDAAAVARLVGVTPQNAQRAIAPLVAGGMVEEFTGFRRNRLWQSIEVLAALDAFSDRAGRRGGSPAD